MATMTNPKMTEEQIRAQFKILDKDGNGLISAEEIRSVLTSLGDELTDDDINEMIADVDKNGDGEVSYEEFLAHMMSGDSAR